MHRPEQTFGLDLDSVDSQSALAIFNQITCDEHDYKEEHEEEMKEAFTLSFQKFYDDLLDDRHNKVTLDKLCKTFMEGVIDNSKTDLKYLRQKILDRGVE